VHIDRRLLHLPLLAVILGAMAVGILAGLGRIGWSVPSGGMDRAALHGPILIAGVFGTLIALDRAIAMRNVTARTWTPADAAPVLGGAGTIVLLMMARRSLSSARGWPPLWPRQRAAERPHGSA
jgi:hypothetical protein